MRRDRLVAALVALVVVAAAIADAGRRAARTPDDPHRSSFVAGPRGASGWAEALRRLGVRVEPYRGRIADLRSGTAGDSVLVAVIGPYQPLDLREAGRLLELPADLLLAGRGARLAIACLGYRIVGVSGGPRAAAPPGEAPGPHAAEVGATLQRHTQSAVADSSAREDGVTTRCAVPTEPAAEPLLVTRAGTPAALRVQRPNGHAAIIVADDGLFANRALRESDAGPFALRLVTPRYRRVVLDEYHHGFGTSGSLGGALLGWSVRSPWGWAVWQLAAVGLVALLATAVRFGPIRQPAERRRRSPLEHVRALAAALQSARGHDVAVGLLARGLRRRLSRSRPERGDTDAWLAALPAAARGPRGREAAELLVRLTREPQDAAGVLRAANAVEDVWEDLSPASATSSRR